jgi:uncharacterized membrane protein
MSLRCDVALPRPNRALAGRKFRTTGALAGALVALGLLAAPVWAAGYSAVELGVLAQGGTVVLRGLNDAGEVVGSGIIADGQRAFVLSRGRLRNIHPGPSSDYSIAHGINSSGVIVGALNLAGSVRAFRWTAAGGIVELPPLAGDTGSEGFSLNAVGEAVGLSAGAGGIRAVRWSPTGAPRPLDALPGANNSRGLAINQAGTAVGVSGNRAVAWSASTASELGGLRRDDPSEALSINASGHIVGSSGDPATRHAVLWGPGSAPRDLGVLTGGTSSRALSINDAGSVVGTSESLLGSRAVVWTGSSGPQDLNDLVTGLTGVVLTHAVAINNLGAIVAVGRDDTGQGVDHAHDAHEHPVRVFLLLPTP